MNAELTEIRFYGHLRPVFGKMVRLDVASPAEAIRALCAVLPGFEAYIRKHAEPGYRVIVDKTPLLAADELHHPSGRQSIKLVPAISGRAGLGKVLGGVALIGLSFVPGLNVAVFAGFSTTFASIALNLGISMALGGVSQMLAGNPTAAAPTERPDNQPSYAFNGAVNTTAQGNPVPLCYGGPLRVGSQLISTGLAAASL